MNRLDELDVVVRRKNGRVVAGVPSLGLYATADDTVAALAKLDEKKRAYEADLEEAGLSEIIVAGGSTAGASTAPSNTGGLRGVALKSGIVIGMITVAVIIGGGLLASRIDATIDRTIYSVKTQLGPLSNGKIGGSQFWSKIESELDRVASADNNLAPEKQARLLQNIRAIVTRIRPFVGEIAPLFANVQAPDSQTPVQSCK
jgi:hypothetical protein